MTEPHIQTYLSQLIPVEKIRTDPDNPNIVTPAELEGLRESMRQFGFLEPIVTDQDYLVANGEHRLQVYKEFGMKEIPTIIVKLTDVDRRLLRQAMNKLKGRHDPDRDIEEIRRIHEAGRLDDLSILAATAVETLRILAIGEEFRAEKAWQGTPGYESRGQWDRTINVHFRSEKDVQRFAKVLGQSIGPKTRSIWYPFRAQESHTHQKWTKKPKPKA